MQEGQILVGKYRVDRVLGVGGTGAVFAAHHLQLDTRVAIKFLRPSLLTNEEAVASFVREARAALQMHNEHVARVFDVGMLATGAPYMVMEFLDGADLGNLLQKRGPLSVEEAVEFVLQACEGLAEAHALGIVHRDLKPTNLFCIHRPDGRPIIKVLDFGISQVVGLGLPPRDQTPTHAAALMGSPLYMAPEQIDATQAVDARTDIWALGVILYELLSAKTPFAGDSLPEVSTKISARSPTPLRDFMPAVPEGLEAVIETCLQKDQRQRYPDVAALGLALLPFGPRRARVSVDRITDMLQAVVLSVPEDSGQDAPASANPMTATPMTATSQPLPPARIPLSGASANSPASPGVTGAVRPTTDKRTVGSLLAIALLGVMGVGVGAGAVVLLWKNGFFPVGGDLTPAATGPTAAPHRGPGATASDPARPSVTATVAEGQSGLGKPATLSVGASVSSFERLDAPVAEDADGAFSGRRGRTGRPGAAGKPAGEGARAGWPARGAITASTGSPSGAAGAQNVDCNPSFDLDDQGRKHFKPECLGARPAAVSATSRPSANCDPSFELDAQGRKHFKPECFVNLKR